MAGPILSGSKHLQNLLGGLDGVPSVDAKEHNPTRGGQTMAAGQFSEILVEGDEHPVFALLPGQHPLVREAWLIVPNPCHVQAAFTQHAHSGARHIFISQIAHQLGRDGIDAHVP